MKEDRKTPEQRAAAKAARQAKLASMTPQERAAAKTERQAKLALLSPEERAARRAKRQQRTVAAAPIVVEAPMSEAQQKKARYIEEQRAKKMQREKKWQRAQQIAELPPAERRAISARMEARRLERLEREGGSSE